MNANEIDQQTLLQNEKDPLTHTPVHLLSLEGVSKYYGNISALSDVSMAVARRDHLRPRRQRRRQVHPDQDHRRAAPARRRRPEIMGEDGFASPREALDRGIATVYQDLAVVPLMPVWRNFFLGSEPTRGRGPFRRLDVELMREITRRDSPDGHRPARRRPAHRHALRRRAPVRGHRPRRATSARRSWSSTSPPRPSA